MKDLPQTSSLGISPYGLKLVNKAVSIYFADCVRESPEVPQKVDHQHFGLNYVEILAQTLSANIKYIGWCYLPCNPHLLTLVQIQMPGR